jgi:pilus assembly protein CpaD
MTNMRMTPADRPERPAMPRLRLPAPASRRIAAAAAAGVMAAALAGCEMTRHEIVGSIPDDYRTRHPIVFDQTLQSMDIPVGLNKDRLTEGEEANIAGFARKFRDSGAASLAVVVPSGSANEVVATRLSAQVRRSLVASGISPDRIEYRVYGANAAEKAAALRIAYNQVSAKTGKCGLWPDRIEETTENRNYYNFGCATQQNLAAQVANPLDLMYPRQQTPPDAERRAVMIDAYRRGEPYQSDTTREKTTVPIARNVGP